MEITITWPELVAVLVLAVGGCLLAVFMFLAHARRDKLEQENLKSELLKLGEHIEGIGRRLNELESRAGSPGKEEAEAETPHDAYDNAVQYARQGMIAAEIASLCGISRDEATLIVALHHKDREG